MNDDKNLDFLVSKKIDEILSRIQNVSSLYVEPGDTVLVTIDKDGLDENYILNLKKLFSSLFSENGGVFLSEGVSVQVVKKGEISTEPTELDKLKEQVKDLQNIVQSLQAQIETYYTEI
jgi:tRNA(Ser,Leu) C12 N-acetylase TAN1